MVQIPALLLRQLSCSVQLTCLINRPKPPSVMMQDHGCGLLGCLTLTGVLSELLWRVACSCCLVSCSLGAGATNLQAEPMSCVKQKHAKPG